MSHFNGVLRAVVAGAAVIGWLAVPATAQTNVGTITVCYYAPSCTYTNSIGLNPPVDSPAFQITNTSASPITRAVFTLMRNRKNEITKDRYTIGKIPAGHSVVIVPGYSDDGKTNHPPGSLFTHTGWATDTSEYGPDADATSFTFTGTIGASTVSSGTIRAGATAGPANDGTIAHLNFLGGPANADGPCNDCFGPKQIGTLTIP
ncbi:MAG TPA: hypothetical protein VGG69_07790 [Rhizomicrobium sp.]|jgi:hypothetical protein